MQPDENLRSVILHQGFGHRSFPQIREILIRADAHRSLDCVIPHEKLGQRQGMALCAVGQIDAAHFVAQMSRLRDEVP